MHIIKSNLRFLSNHFFLNLSKVMLNAIGLLGAGYFFSRYVALNFISATPLVIALCISIITFLAYGLLQQLTLRSRLQEVFIRKWYGGKCRDIFLVVFTEHLLLVIFSVLVAVFFIDVLNNFLPFFTIGLSRIPIFYISVFINAVILLITGSLDIKKLSKSKISELLIKIS